MSDDSILWGSLGRYIGQSFLKKKGVVIPGLGTFTFSTQVSLEGINPALTKNRDDREPVFIVSSELSPGVRSGISHGTGLRPYTNKGVSGLTPTVKINLAEVSQLSGLSKDEIKKRLDGAIRKLSEDLKKGDLRVDIPGLGTLVSKSNIVAVFFNQRFEPVLGPGNLTEDGAKWLKDELDIDMGGEKEKEKERPYSNSNSKSKSRPRIQTAGANRKDLLQENNRGMRGGLASEDGLDFNDFLQHMPKPEDSKPITRPLSTNNLFSDREAIEFPHSGKSLSSLKMQSLGSNFLKIPPKESSNNIDYILENESKLRLIFSLKDPGNRGLLSTEEFTESLNMLENPKLTESVINQLMNISGCKSSNKIRYNLFLDYLQKQKSQKRQPIPSAQSDYTAKYSKSSILPFARKIWGKRLEFTKSSQEGGMRPRVICSASELLSILKRSEVSLNIHQLKALLRECGFIQASPLDLIRGVRNLLAPESSDVSVYSEILSEAHSWAPLHDENMDIIRRYLKDYNLQEFYRKACRSNGVLELEDFVEYISQQSRGAIKGFEAEHAFRKAARNRHQITESEFCTAFQAVRVSSKATEVTSIEKVKNWLKAARLSSAQGFARMLEFAGATECLTKEQFVRAVGRIDISPREAEVFFRLLDGKNDGKLDQVEWKNKLYEDNMELNEMRDTVMAYGLDPNEILSKMDLKGKSKISVEELCGALQRIDPSLNSRKAVEIARSLTGLNNDMNVNEFIEKISSHPDANWMINLLDRVRARGGYEAAKKLFEAADERCMGKIDAGVFAECVNRAGLGLSISEIEKLSRTLGRGLNTVDYMQFLEQIRPRMALADPQKILLGRLMMYLKQNNLKPEEFLTKMGGRISVAKFAEFLAQKVLKDMSKSESMESAARFDINEDGWIDITDLMLSIEKTRDNQELHEISADKAANLLTSIRKIMAAKKLNYQDAFNFFDTEKNGLISCKEFCEGLDRLTEISDPVKLGLFAYIDRQKVGLIDFETFAEVLKYSDIKSTKTNDSWDWENNVIDKIRVWIEKEGVTIEEAFRAFDKDFDGIINKEDLKKALIAVLKIKETEIGPSKIERLYKLMDVYKRDSVQLSDFKSIFEEKRAPEWRDAAKQSLGLFVSKKYYDPQEAFEAASGKTDRVTLVSFLAWINSTQVLTEYRLTNQLIQQLFAYLDPHKKGYLSAEDWTLCLGTFNYSTSCLQEVKDAIRSNFSDVKTAFDYFLTYHTETPPDKISLKDFEKAVEAIIPKRFSKKDFLNLWKKIFFSNTFIAFNEFREVFDDCRYMSAFTPSRGRATSARTNLTASSNKTKSSLSDDPLKRLQALIRASPYSIEDIFKEMDSDNSGTLSLLEFRNAMRKLNIGLSAKDIDGLLARIDTNNDGQIDWQEFQKQFKSSETENQIKSSCQARLNSLRMHMGSFMLSARDAFSQFDPEHSGKLSFNSFTALVQRLCELAREPVPAFPVIKDLFDIIDIRKDGYLDMREWLNTFKEAEKNTWEDSKQYEEICRRISKNRKMLLDTFEQVGRSGKADYAQTKEVLGTAIKDIQISEEQWRKIVGVACRDNFVDYRSLLDIYKQRCTSAQMHPR